jgi:hypothetical protein
MASGLIHAAMVAAVDLIAEAGRLGGRSTIVRAKELPTLRAQHVAALLPVTARFDAATS